MKRKPVKSSVIKSIGYNEDKQLLEVEIVDSGRVYQYKVVPLEIYLNFVEAESLGKYYNEIIKPGFDGEEVT